MRTYYKLCYLGILISFFACDADKVDLDPIQVPNSTPMEPEIDTVATSGDEQYLTLDSDYLFDQDRLPTFNLNIPLDNLAFLDADPTAEEYIEGSLIFEGDTISPVGIRYKGSIGAYVNCLSGTNWADPSGFKTCTKLSMKVKINWEGRSEKFYGLKKLQFHAMNLDQSQMRDRLGYWLFREMGTPAPRCVHARLFINGEYSGLYSLVEQVDGRFTDYNWDDGDGNLYKEIWPLRYDGVAFSETEYLNALKTNEDDNPSPDIIRQFALSLEQASTIEEIKAVLESSLDVTEALSYCVVDRMIRHDDGPFHWYCEGNDCSPHNFYWYEEPASEKLHLIAWDLDNAFENISSPNPVTEVPDAWGETRNNCNPFRNGFFGITQKSAACDKIVGGLASYEDEYNAIKEAFKQDVFSETQINAQLDKWANQISDATLEAHSLHDDAISATQWQTGLQTLKNQLRTSRNQ